MFTEEVLKPLGCGRTQPANDAENVTARHGNASLKCTAIRIRDRSVSHACLACIEHHYFWQPTERTRQLSQVELSVAQDNYLLSLLVDRAVEIYANQIERGAGKGLQ